MQKRSDPEKADIAIARATAPARKTAPVRALGWISEIADQPPLISICTASLAAGLILRNARLARAGGRMLAAELLATQFKSLIKHRVDRTRPSVLAKGGKYEARRGHDHDSEMNSFPSGHTAGAVAVARALTREYPEHKGAAYASAAAIGAIQIPRSKHYPTDVAAGAVVGLTAEAAVHICQRLCEHAAARLHARHRGLPGPR